jgi:hypothetical protein
MPVSVVIFLVMLAGVAIIAGYHKVVARDEDDFLHTDDPTGQLAAHQMATARSLNAIDRVGIGLAIATAVYGVVLLAVYLYDGLTNYGKF